MSAVWVTWYWRHTRLLADGTTFTVHYWPPRRAGASSGYAN